MVKEALFSDRDMEMIAHVLRDGVGSDPFPSDVARRQARSRLRRKIENDAAPFLLTHLQEWRSIKAALDSEFIDNEVRDDLQRQIWSGREAMMRFLLDWIPTDKMGEFLNAMFVGKYLDLAVTGEGGVDPLVPLSFLRPYLSQLTFEDPEVEKTRLKLINELSRLQELTSAKRSVMTFKPSDDLEAPWYSVWQMDKEMLGNLLTYQHSEDQSLFIYVLPHSQYQASGVAAIRPFFCLIDWLHWILSVAMQVRMDSGKSVTYNQLMNRAIQYIAYEIQDDIIEQYGRMKEKIDDPSFSTEKFQETVLRLMNEYFDNYRTNEPGRPSSERSQRVLDTNASFTEDKQITLDLGYLGRLGGKGRKVPLDERKNPDRGSGRGFKAYLRRRVNTLISMGFLEQRGRGFVITDKGMEVERHRGELGVMPAISPSLSLHWLSEGIALYSKRYPKLPRDVILRAILRRIYPKAVFLNLDILSAMIEDVDLTSAPKDGNDGG